MIAVALILVIVNMINFGYFIRRRRRLEEQVALVQRQLERERKAREHALSQVEELLRICEVWQRVDADWRQIYATHRETVGVLRETCEKLIAARS